jgi:hypothetical protein
LHEEILKPKVELLTLSLKIADPAEPNPFNKIFGVDEELKSHGPDLIVRKINFYNISPNQIDSFFLRCPKLPSDIEARIGVRRNPKTLDIELPLGLELPVGCLTISENIEVGSSSSGGPKIPNFILNLVQRERRGHRPTSCYCIYLFSKPNKIFSLKPFQTLKFYFFHPLTNFLNTTTHD